MSVVATDLVAYGSANMPEADGVTCGGAIDLTTRVIFADSAAANTLNGKLDIVSSNAGDTTQTVTITGRNTAGSVISETLSLNGTTTVLGANIYERILKIVVSAAHTGTITVTEHTGGATLVAIESGVLTIRRPFYNVSADASGGSTRNFYEKIFIKNNNGTNALLSAQIIQQANPAGLTGFALANAVNDTETTANRQTAPVAVTAFNTTTKNVPGTDLAAGAAIGVWLNMTLAAGAAAAKSTYTLRASGQTT